MSIREIVRQLHAAKKAKPVHRYSTLHIRPSDNPMLVAFVRMAGESRPWAIAYGNLKDPEPKVLSVPDGRNRIAVSEMCEIFAVDLLGYFRVTGYTLDPITKDSFKEKQFCQIWVPSARHVEMFHHLQYSYWRARKGDDRSQPLTAFARLSGWIFRESARLGQQAVVDASAFFRNSFVFPSDSTSLGHLGTCIEWFGEHEDLRSARLAVRGATLLRDSPTLDPELDSKIFSPLLEKRAKILSENRSTLEVDQLISNALAPEVTRRWKLIVSSYEIFAADTREVNPGVGELVRDTFESFYSNFQRIEENLKDPDLGPAYTQHPETDFHGSAAAANFFAMTAADTTYLATLVHFDEELQAEALASGRAFNGIVTHVADTGVGRITTPVWTMDIGIQERLRIREGEKYSPLMAPGHGIQIRSVEILHDSILQIVAEWTDRKTKSLENPQDLRPSDLEWVGARVMFVPKDGSDFDKSKSRAVWNASTGPGAWLTHGTAPAPVETSIVDDITQLKDQV